MKPPVKELTKRQQEVFNFLAQKDALLAAWFNYVDASWSCTIGYDNGRCWQGREGVAGSTMFALIRAGLITMRSGDIFGYSKWVIALEEVKQTTIAAPLLDLVARAACKVILPEPSENTIEQAKMWIEDALAEQEAKAAEKRTA